MQTLSAASFALATRRFCLSSTLRQSTRQAINSVHHLAHLTAIQARYELQTCVVPAVPSVSNCLSFHHRVPGRIFADHRVLAILAVDARGGPGHGLHCTSERCVAAFFLPCTGTRGNQCFIDDECFIESCIGQRGHQCFVSFLGRHRGAFEPIP